MNDIQYDISYDMLIYHVNINANHYTLLYPFLDAYHHLVIVPSSAPESSTCYPAALQCMTRKAGKIWGFPGMEVAP